MVLVAAFARGGHAWRLIGLRRSGDRSLAVLELAAPAPVRMHVDAESGLVRVVERTEHRTGVGDVHLTEHYRDYRNVDGVRVPHFRTTFVDGTVEGTTTLWESFLPVAPQDAVFEAEFR